MSDQTQGSPFSGISEDVFSAGAAAIEAVESAEEELDEVEATPETDEVLAEDAEVAETEEVEGGEEPEAAAGETPAETEKPATVIPVKFYGEVEEFDLLADIEETTKLIQLGKDHAKKSGLNDAITKGLVRYDVENGGLAPGPAYENAKLEGANAALDALSKAGVVQRSLDGQWGVAPAVLQALSRAAPQDSADQAETELETLKQAYTDNPTPETWVAYDDARNKHQIQREFQTRDAKQREVVEAQTREQQLAQAIEAANSQMDAEGERLRGLYNDPDGTFDEESWQTDLDIAKQLMLSQRNGKYQYPEALAALKKKAQTRAAQTKRIVALLAKSKPARNGSTKPPAGRPATGQKPRTTDREFDPNDPFGGISLPLEAIQ